ncbi:MAG: hypothetical protein JWN63_3478, partial [Candidatus Acidoferrum typicum]|nr:hypothetical protein [Candidatus Acidoferrum typicum]
AKGRRPIWGQRIMRKQIHPAVEKLRIQKANRMAHLPPFLFKSASASRNRYQSPAGIITAFVGAVDPGYLHASCHSGQARGAKRGRKTPSTARIRTSCCTYDKQFKYKYLEADIYALAGRGCTFLHLWGDIAIHSQVIWNVWRGRRGSNPRPLP